MKIVQFHAENIKRLKAVDITPAGNCVIISGKNENGKTSVLDSIWLALEYRAAVKKNPEPLRKGTTKGLVTLDLGDYIVTRRFTESDSTLEIRTPDGSKITSPQKLLDGMYSDLSFDPLEFSRKSEQEQRVMLADLLYKITEGKLNLADFDARKQEAYDARTEANREKKQLASLLANLRPPVDSDPQEEVSSHDVTASITEAMNINQRISLVKSVIESSEEAIKREEIELERIKSFIEAEKQKAIQYKNELSSLEPQDVPFLQGQLKEIEINNKRAREVVEYRKLREGLEKIEEEINKLNAKMELIDIEKAEALEASPLPVKGLTVNAEGVRILNEEGKEVPYSQASAARRFEISVALAMAANPTLRVIRIEDGSLLDDERLEKIEQMAKDQDYQVWIEYRSKNDQDRIGVYIEDGEVA